MLKATQLSLACALTLWIAPCQWAQQEEAAATPQDEAPASPAEEPTAAPTIIPDTRPLSGAEELRVETAGSSRNYAIPSLRVSVFGDSNRSILTTGQRSMEMTGSVLGGLAVHRASRRSEFSMDYTGGAGFYARNSELNATMHQLFISQRYTGRRWGLTLGDQLSFLPESSFGFGGLGPSIGMGGGGGGSLNPSYVPNQSVYTGGGDRLSNTGLAQIEYYASARSSFSFTGTYGILRFMDPGFIESNSMYASTGYNYAASRRDTVSITYGFGATRFIGSDLHMDNHVASLAYGRRVTGRLAFSVSGGPQFVIRRTPAIGSVRTSSFFARTTMDYKVGRTNLNWTYAHYTSNGSGVFLGAETDNIRGSIHRRLSRNWSWTVGPGYSRNNQLTSGSGTTTDSVFNSIYGHTSLNRKLGRYTDLAFSYNVYRQWSDTTSLTGTARTSSYLRHFFGMSVTWHGSRVGLD